MPNLVRILRARYKIVYFITTKHQQALEREYSEYFNYLLSLAINRKNPDFYPFKKYNKKNVSIFQDKTI